MEAAILKDKVNEKSPYLKQKAELLFGDTTEDSPPKFSIGKGETNLLTGE
jgi:hypothetical protein